MELDYGNRWERRWEDSEDGLEQYKLACMGI
jgi:hypothetical protein